MSRGQWRVGIGYDRQSGRVVLDIGTGSVDPFFPACFVIGMTRSYMISLRARLGRSRLRVEIQKYLLQGSSIDLVLQIPTALSFGLHPIYELPYQAKVGTTGEIQFFTLGRRCP